MARDCSLRTYLQVKRYQVKSKLRIFRELKKIAASIDNRIRSPLTNQCLDANHPKSRTTAEAYVSVIRASLARLPAPDSR
jgi:hypothetical protein